LPAGRRRSRRRLPDRATRLADLKARGVRGGIIQPHRAMLGMAIPPRTILAAALLGLAGAVGATAALNPLAELWARLFEALAGPLGLSAGVGTQSGSILGLYSLQTPFYLVTAGAPSPETWRLVAIISAAVLLLTLALPQRFIPLRYFLRFLVLLQGISLGYFALAPAGSFPYTLPSYSAGLLAVGQVVLVLLPLVLAVTFYLFDIKFIYKRNMVEFLVIMSEELVIALPLGRGLLPMMT